MDTRTDDYIEFTAQGPYEELQIELSGNGFFDECQKNLASVVYEEDRAQVSAALERTTLLDLLQEKHAHSVVYRLMTDGVPTCCRMKMVMAEHAVHMVIGVSRLEAELIASFLAH